MTGMRIISAAIPEDLDKAILDFRKRDECIRLTYSEVIRRLLYAGLGQPMPELEVERSRGRAGA